MRFLTCFCASLALVQHKTLERKIYIAKC